MRPPKQISALTSLLDRLADQGLSQVDIAQSIGVAPQFLSDLKTGRRHLSELTARRLAAAFGVDHRSLMTTEPGTSTPASVRRIVAGSGDWLPVLPHPVECAPTAHPRWKGTYFHVPAIAGPALAKAVDPYVLRYANDDVTGRLHKGDCLLMSQRPNDKAEIVVIRSGNKCFLARRRNAEWVRVADGQLLGSQDPVVGHCLGIVWSSLR
jgi:transcriptional regulator with XRE-family HTH domain